MNNIGNILSCENTKAPSRLTLVQKIIAGYCAIALFTIAALCFSTMGLVSIHRIAREIARTDLIFINQTQLLRESLTAQERYAGKYLILGSAEFSGLFKKREKEFVDTLEAMQREKNYQELNELKNIYNRYQLTANSLLSGGNSSSQALQSASAKVFVAIDTISAIEQQRINAKLENAHHQQQSTVKWTLFLSFAGFLLATIVAAYVTFSISNAIKKLKKATHRIAEGEFDFDPMIPEGDEIGDLARDFMHMAGRLKDLEQISLDASPLTRLPGNIAIERVLNQRISAGDSFAVCYFDLDNFKAYNDRYGYIKASELIKLTGEIIYNETHIISNDAFVGHVGGDDFIVILGNDLAKEVCEAVIATFTREIVSFYSEEDIARGAIEGVDRYGVHRVFPIMTLSIAVIVSQKDDEYDSAVEIAHNAAQIKDYVKGQPGSNYFINRRKRKK